MSTRNSINLSTRSSVASIGLARAKVGSKMAKHKYKTIEEQMRIAAEELR
jgi:hypothetical protein